ncbi:MAG: hypothetical protein EP343_24785 [Deltaproteobacteria bacterium]|nr:MAG: hypothetical protein EP343_24785 [Deltaproteobacteria bacterium]
MTTPRIRTGSSGGTTRTSNRVSSSGSSTPARNVSTPKAPSTSSNQFQLASTRNNVSAAPTAKPRAGLTRSLETPKALETPTAAVSRPTTPNVSTTSASSEPIRLAQRTDATAAPKSDPSASPALNADQQKQVDRMGRQLDQWLSQDVTDWNDYAFKDVAKYTREGSKTPFVKRLLDLPNTPETAELKAKWLDLAGQYANSHRQHPAWYRMSNAGVGIYNSMQIDPMRQAMSEVLASDPKRIVDHFDNTSMDPMGQKSFSPMMHAMLDRSDTVRGTEIGVNREIRQNLASAISQLAGPVIEQRGAAVTPENQESLARAGHHLGYLLGGMQGGYEQAFHNEATRKREQAEMMKTLVGLASDTDTGHPAANHALKVVNALAGAGIDRSFNQDIQRNFNSAVSDIQDFQGLYRRMIDADNNYHLDQMILPKYNNVLLQSRFQN